MDETWYYVLGVTLLLSCLLPVGYLLGRNQQYTTIPKKPEYQNHVTGLNLVGLEAGNYSYDLEIKNPYENMSIRVYSYLFSDPEDLRRYVVYSCSVKNGTLLSPFHSINATYRLTVFENPYPEGEFYVRVGCLRVGVDF